MRNEKGFSLVELMVTMVVFVFVLAAGSQIFTALLTQFKQQSKIGETDIEGAVGLDIMRYDLAHAGYGLPWNVQSPGTWAGLTNYYEAASNAGLSPNPANFNDGNAATGTGGSAPRAIVSGPGAGLNGSDYLSIKSANASGNQTAGKWTYLKAGPSTTVWTPSNQNINKDDSNNAVTPKAVVLSMGNVSNITTQQALVLDGSNNWYLTYTGDPSTAGFAPTGSSNTPDLIYAIDPNTNLRMPFNRADYYIRVPTNSPMPRRCAPNTAILYKATVNHNGGGLSEMPILDCVAYMYVDYWLDTNNDGAIDWPPQNDISALTADQIRAQLMEVRVYIVAQEGQKDINYDFSEGGTRNNLSANEVLQTSSRTLYFPAAGNLSTLIGSPDYKYYRWRLYTLVVQPNSLR